MKLSDFFRLSDPSAPADPAVYLIRRAADGAFKIGMSERVGNRTKTIVGQCGEAGAEVLHVIRTERPREAEAFFHRMFRAARLQGEWFRLTAEDVSRIRSFETWPRA